jgi:hypothetical protein
MSFPPRPGRAMNVKRAVFKWALVRGAVCIPDDPASNECSTPSPDWYGGDARSGNRITHRTKFRPAILDVLDRDVGKDDILQ